MLRLKPTTLIALDPYTAAFCERVRSNLDRDFGARGSLIQSYALTVKGTEVAFQKDLLSIADFSFNPGATRKPGAITADEAQAAFEASSDKLEGALSEILDSGRRSIEIEKAHQAGIEIVKKRMVYLLLSSSDILATGIVIELARLIRWLFATRYANELYDLHAVVLLPNLFAPSQQADFAAAYGLLKILDNVISSGLRITAQRKMPPFDGCWLVDGINSEGEKIGSLAEELDSYADTFAGFLTAEPEMSGALVGTRTSRGKIPAYSAFGHGELYFPSAIAVRRLSSALSRDIIKLAFLGEQVEESDIERKVLLSAKQFVLSEKYTDALNGLETEKGALIWHDLQGKGEFDRDNDPMEYVGQQKRQHTEFERESLPKFKEALVTRSEAVLKELIQVLAAEIDRRIDEKTEGIREVPPLLERLVDHSIALSASSLGEHPQNFITALFEAEAILDDKLGVQVDHTQTELLLKQVYELNNRLADLETTMRITKSQPGAEQPANGPMAELEFETDEQQDTLASEQRNLISEIEETHSQITAAHADYVRELIREQRAANQLRYDAKERVRTERAEAVIAAEEEITKTADLLRHARIDLQEKQLQRHQFLIRHFVIYPAIAMLLIAVPGVAAAIGIPFALFLAGIFWASLFGSLLLLLILSAAYTATVLYFFMTGINKAVNAARTEVSSLELRLKAARVRLIDARNRQLRLEYDIYAQGLRVETLKKLIESTRQRIKELEKILTALADTHARFASKHESAIPPSSYMRRPILTAADIDEYYRKLEPNIPREVKTFIDEHMRRSRVRYIPFETFEAKVESFAQSRFQSVGQLSVEDLLLRSPDLVSSEQVSARFQELDKASAPLVLLSEMDGNDDTFAQRDVTIWAGATESEPLLNRYRQVNTAANIRPSENEHTFRALTRCLNFPAFFLSQIEFYRSCYDKAETKVGASLPDIVPEELTISSESRRAYESLLLAIATGLISVNGDGSYEVADGNGSVLGSSRRQIAERFVIDYRSQRAYAEISNRLAKRLSEPDQVYESVIGFMETASDLDSFEQEILVALSRRYHPLR